MLSKRLEEIYKIFGQIPDVLEDAWIKAAEGDIEAAKKVINEVPKEHPFEIKYHHLHSIPWERVSEVMDAKQKRDFLPSVGK